MRLFLSFQITSLRHQPKIKMSSPAARNKGPILEILKRYFTPDIPGNVLEISSGSGEHVQHFAPHFPKLTFQPSEFGTNLLGMIKLYTAELENVRNPLHIDVTTPWNIWGLHTDNFNYILNFNMIHITPYNCTEGLFKNAAALLIPKGLLITYGPYSNNGILIPESNVNFDKFLRTQNEEWGVRDIARLRELGDINGLSLIEIHDMPANNKCLIWKNNNQ